MADFWAGGAGGAEGNRTPDLCSAIALASPFSAELSAKMAVNPVNESRTCSDLRSRCGPKFNCDILPRLKKRGILSAGDLMMTFRAWINSQLPTWVWNLKNRLTGNPYRERVDTFKRVPGVNYSLDTNADAQGFFVKDCTIAGGVRPMHGVAGAGGVRPMHGVNGIAYRDAQGNLIEYVPSSTSREG